ncbi:PA14-related domain protein [Shewanella halifaxensis HAW-EB4]|uniref:PA14-related domain protein n=2 Tax=Shewanella halifaxensis TaxID=271098 RepID=B0TVS7_SHEHH|nr:PA14-related domain protein [Shewanella halifaxensis HAW-EB4]
MAADWTQTFKEGVNSYSSSGQIRFHSGSKLFDAPNNGRLPSYSVTDSTRSACVPANGNSKKCKAGNFTARLPSDRFPFAQCASTSNKNLGPSDAVNYVIEVPEGEYSNINSHFYYHTVKFTNSDTGIYRIKQLNIQDGILELAPGQYWIENLQIAEGVTVRFPTSGTVSFFVKNHFVQYNSMLPYRSEFFMLYGYSDIDLAEDSYLRGHIVSEGRLIFSEEARVEGAVTSDYIAIDDDGWVQFDDRAYLIDLVPNCDLDLPNPPVIPQCPAEQNNIQGLTYRTYDAESWDDDGDSPEDHDDFEDLIDEVKKTRYQIGESIETNLNQKGNGINPHSNAAADQDQYLGIFEGYIDAPETGEYTFAIDGDDAIELLIDGEVITGFYGAHGTCNCTRYQGKVSLEQGAHTIELRFHEAFGSEAFRLYWQTPSSNRFEIVPADNLLTCPAPQFEFGRVELDANGKATISFDNTYAAPPVIMVMPTIDGADANGDHSSTVRVDSLSSSNASIKQLNSGSSQVLDKKMDKVDYFVMEPGYRFLERGKALQAGSISTELYQGKNLPSSGRGYESIEFEHDFGIQPAMIGQTLTHNNNRFITTVINNVDADGSQFDIAIEGSEMSSVITHPELLGFVAGVGQGVMTVNGENLKYEFANGLNYGNGSSVRTLSQQCAFNNNYQQTYSAQPLTIANKNQRRGGDGGWVRRCTKDSFNNQVSFAIDEYQHTDGERRHLAESIGYFAFEYAPEPPAVNHYQINFNSGALSCAAKSITIQACANTDCTSLLSDPASVTLTKNNTNYTRTTFTGNTTTELWHPEGGLVTLGLSSTLPTANYSCYIDGAFVVNSQCQLNFEDSGIYFNIDDSTACKNSNNFELFAVKKDQTTQQCVPLFANKTKPISMAFNYITPDAAGINEAAKLTINSLNAPTASKEIAGGASQELQVHFDANGKALLNVNYPEAGKVELAATLTETISSPDGSTSETLVLEHSEQFVSKPDGFHFFNDSGRNGCSGASCDLFAKAGDDFKMNVKAVCGVDDGTSYKDRPALKNFQFSDLKIKPVLQAPLITNGDEKDGGLGGLGLTQLNFSKTNSAPLKVTNQSYSEVGAISIMLDGEVNYLGATIAEANSSSETFGRFSPYYLTVTGNTPSLEAQCGSFTYMGQPFGFLTGKEPTLSITGKSKSGANTNNYQIGDWWRYHGNQWNNRSYSDTSGATSVNGDALQILDGSPISEKVEYYPIDQNNTVQRAYLTGTLLHYARTASLAVPFNAQFDLDLSKTDVTDIDAICYQDSASGACIGFNFDDIAKGDGFVMRYGRLAMQNAYGPSSEELRLEVSTQYVNAAGKWVTNTSDSCSVFDTTSATESADVGLNLKPDVGLEAVQGFTQTGGSGKAGAIGLGNSFIYFPAPHSDGEVGLQQHVDKWLQWYWNYDGNTGLQDPRATAYFGTYRGHDRIIYWREVN